MDATSLIQGVANLRFVTVHDLGNGCYVFPRLDDFDAIEKWTSGQVPCWPRARCLLDRDGDDEGCFRMDIEILPKGEESDITNEALSSDEDEGNDEVKESESSQLTNDKPLSSLVDDLFESPFQRTSKIIPEPQREGSTKSRREARLGKILRHLYKGPIEAVGAPSESEDNLRPRRHPNFSRFFGIVNGSLANFCLTKSDHLTLSSFSKFNRHALRLFSKSDELAGEELIGTTHGEVESAAPPLIGANPILDGECDVPARFLFYQCLQGLKYLHRVSQHLSLCPDAFSVTSDLWIELRPPCSSSIRQNAVLSPADERDGEDAIYGVRNNTVDWRQGKMSNLEYLLNINAAAGRRTGGFGSFHAILPWVKDFESGNPRDLRRSKFRLKKGDKQLDTTFRGSADPLALSLESRRGEMPHHIPESLSELTYYVYAARISPIRALQRVVRHNFEPKEYPSSMARLYEWSPDECVPEFFVDPGLFLPNHGLNCLLCGKSKTVHQESSEEQEEPLQFLREHCAYLENQCSPLDLAAWIDLTFGVALHGRLAVENKNVALVPTRRRLEPYQLRQSPEFVRVFERPHPTTKTTLSSQAMTVHPPAAGAVMAITTKDEESKQREEEFLLHVFQAMLAPRDGLRVRVQYENKASSAPSQVNPVSMLSTGGASMGTTGASLLPSNAGGAAGSSSSSVSVALIGTIASGSVGHSAPMTLSSMQPGTAAAMDSINQATGAHLHHELNVEPTRSTFLGSDLVEWLVRRQIPGVASASDAVALAQKMMAAGFFVPERQGAEDDFVDADDAYRFRERREVKRHPHSQHQQPDVRVPRPFGGTENFDASDAGLCGLQMIQTYYHPSVMATNHNPDLVAMALIIAELYLGRPMRSDKDLDVIPLAVATSLREIRQGRIREADQLLHSDLFPAYFEPLYEFLSTVKMAENESDRYKVFCEYLPELGNKLKQVTTTSPRRHQEAVWLILPCAYQLMRSESLKHLGQIFIALRPFVQDDGLVKTLVEACFTSNSSSASTPAENAPEGPDWAKYLPADLFLDRFIDVFVASRGETKSVERGLKIGLEGKAGLTKRAIQLIKSRASSSAMASELVRRLDTWFTHQQQPLQSTATITKKSSFTKSDLHQQHQHNRNSAETNDDDGNNSEEESAAAGPNNHNNSTLDSSLLSFPPGDNTGKGPSTNQASATASTTPTAASHFRRAVHSRVLAHSDAMITTMASAVDGSPRFVTGSRRGELALWGWDDHGAFETCRFRCHSGMNEDGIGSVVHTARFLPQAGSKIMVATSKTLSFQSSNAAVFDLGKAAAQRTTSWFPAVRCFEPFASSREVVCLGSESDVILADLRTSRSVSRFCIPHHHQQQSPIVRCINSAATSPSSLVCALGERMVELDIRMIGKVVRDWKTIGKLTRLLNLGGGGDDDFGSGKRLLVSVVRGGIGASVWDLSGPFGQPKERLRAFTGFDEEVNAIGIETGPAGSSVTSPGVNAGLGGASNPIDPLSSSASILSTSAPSASSSNSGMLFPTLLPPVQLPGSFQMENMDDWDSLTALAHVQDSISGTEGPFLYVVRGTHKIARVPLKLHDAPLEVRVRPLSLTQLGTAKRYKYGALSLSSICQIPGQMLLVGGHDMGGGNTTEGSFVHALV